MLVQYILLLVPLVGRLQLLVSNSNSGHYCTDADAAAHGGIVSGDDGSSSSFSGGTC